MNSAMACWLVRIIELTDILPNKRLSPVHPRACGERKVNVGKGLRTSGSSPHVAGDAGKSNGSFLDKFEESGDPGHCRSAIVAGL